MENLAASAESTALGAGAQRQRRHYRQKIHNLAYINLDRCNGGIIRNLSETGIAIQAVAPLQENQQVYLRFELLNPRIRIEATGRVVWIDAGGQAGLEFGAIPQRSLHQLKDWVLTQLLAASYQACNAESIFIHGKQAEHAAELVFSAQARPAIHLEPGNISVREEDEESEAAPVDLLWYPVPLSPRTLSRMVDTLIVAAAVLLFCVVAVAITHVFPTWPLALALALGVAGAFAALYWFLFVFWIGFTPGKHLARLACSESGAEESQEDDTPRFR